MQHYDHIGASFYLGAVYTPSTVTLMDVRAGTATLARGVKGSAVSQLQTMLKVLNFRDQEGKVLVIDSIFGPRTENALKSAQAAIRARVPATIMLAGALDKPTLLALDALQAGQMLPGEVPAKADIPVGPGGAGKPSGEAEGGTQEDEAAWWQSPWVIGAGTLALVAAIGMMSSDGKPKAR